jgi:hypothetical protein
MAFEQDASDVLAQFDHLEMLGNFVDKDVRQQKLVHLSNVIRNCIAAERERCASDTALLQRTAFDAGAIAERERCIRIAACHSPQDWSPEGMRNGIVDAIREGE